MNDEIAKALKDYSILFWELVIRGTKKYLNKQLSKENFKENKLQYRELLNIQKLSQGSEFFQLETQGDTGIIWQADLIKLPKDDFENFEQYLAELKRCFFGKIFSTLDKKFQQYTQVFTVIKKLITLEIFDQFKASLIHRLLSAEPRSFQDWYKSLPEEMDPDLSNLIQPIKNFYKKIYLEIISLRSNSLDSYPYYTQHFIYDLFLIELYKAILESDQLLVLDRELDEIYLALDFLKEQIKNSVECLQLTIEQSSKLGTRSNYQTTINCLESFYELLKANKALYKHEGVELNSDNLYGFDLEEILRKKIYLSQELVNLTEFSTVLNAAFIEEFLYCSALCIQLYLAKKKSSDKKHKLIASFYNNIFTNLILHGHGINLGLGETLDDYSSDTQILFKAYNDLSKILAFMYKLPSDNLFNVVDSYSNISLKEYFEPNLINLLEILDVLDRNFSLAVVRYKNIIEVGYPINQNFPEYFCDPFACFIKAAEELAKYILENILYLFPELKSCDIEIPLIQRHFKAKQSYEEQLLSCQTVCTEMKKFFIQFLLYKTTISLFNYLIASKNIINIMPQKSFKEIYLTEMQSSQRDDKFCEILQRICILVNKDLISREIFYQEIYPVIKNNHFPTMNIDIEFYKGVLKEVKESSDIKHKLEASIYIFKIIKSPIQDTSSLKSGIPFLKELSFNLLHDDFCPLYQPLLDVLLDITRIKLNVRLDYTLVEKAESYSLLEGLMGFCQKLLKLSKNFQAEVRQNDSILQLKSNKKEIVDLVEYLEPHKDQFKLIQMIIERLEALVEKHLKRIDDLEIEEREIEEKQRVESERQKAKEQNLRQRREAEQEKRRIEKEKQRVERERQYLQEVESFLQDLEKIDLLTEGKEILEEYAKKIKNTLEELNQNYTQHDSYAKLSKRLKEYKQGLRSRLECFRAGSGSPRAEEEEYRQFIKAVDQLSAKLKEGSGWVEVLKVDRISELLVEHKGLLKRMKKGVSTDPMILESLEQKGAWLEGLKSLVDWGHGVQLKLGMHRKTLEAALTKGVLTSEYFGVVLKICSEYEELKEGQAQRLSLLPASVHEVEGLGLERLTGYYYQLLDQINQMLKSFLLAKDVKDGKSLSIRLRAPIGSVLHWMQEHLRTVVSGVLEALQETLVQLDRQIEQEHREKHAQELREEVTHCMQDLIAQIERQVQSRKISLSRAQSSEADPFLSELKLLFQGREEAGLKAEFRGSIDLWKSLAPYLGAGFDLSGLEGSEALEALEEGTPQKGPSICLSGLSDGWTQNSPVSPKLWKGDRLLSLVEAYLLLGGIQIFQKHLETGDSPLLSRLALEHAEIPAALEELRKVLVHKTRDVYWKKDFSKDLKTFEESLSKQVLPLSRPPVCGEEIRRFLYAYARLKQLKHFTSVNLSQVLQNSKDWTQVVPWVQLDKIEHQIRTLYQNVCGLSSSIRLKAWFDAKESQQVKTLEAVQMQWAGWLNWVLPEFSQGAEADQIWGVDQIQQTLEALSSKLSQSIEAEEKFDCLVNLAVGLATAPLAELWREALGELIYDVTERPKEEDYASFEGSLTEVFHRALERAGESFEALSQRPKDKERIRKILKGCLEKRKLKKQYRTPLSVPSFHLDKMFPALDQLDQEETKEELSQNRVHSKSLKTSTCLDLSKLSKPLDPEPTQPMVAGLSLERNRSNSDPLLQVSDPLLQGQVPGPSQPSSKRRRSEYRPKYYSKYSDAYEVRYHPKKPLGEQLSTESTERASETSVYSEQARPNSGKKGSPRGGEGSQKYQSGKKGGQQNTVFKTYLPQETDQSKQGKYSAKFFDPEKGQQGGKPGNNREQYPNKYNRY